MSVVTPQRPIRRVVQNYVKGAGSLLGWTEFSGDILTQGNFVFLRDDLEALLSDWLLIGNDIRVAIESEMAANGDEKDTPPLVLPGNHEKQERQ